MKTVFSLGKEVLGKGPTIYNWQKTLGNLLAVACSDNSVKIFDRHGQRIEEISIPGKCVGLDWNENGDTLAVIADLSPTIFLWDANWHRPNQLDSTVKDKMTFLMWAKTMPVLAVGTAKGNLLLYNQQTSRKIHILGKHNNKITCGAWSSQNLLALGSDDNTLSISDLEGVTLLQKSICGNLREMHFSTMKTNNQSPEGEKTVSLLAGKKTLILLNIDCPDDPIELAFQQNYGSIVCHHWYGDGYIIIGFSHGDLVVISTHPQEIGREIFHCHDHNGSLISVAVTEVIGKVATCGNNCIKIHDLGKMNEIDHVITLDSEPKGLGELQWVADGHLLAVATQRGALHVFLARLPQLGAACGTRIAHLTSLREVTICSPVEEEPSLTLEIDIEPSIIGAGPDHVAVCLNNRVWFYAILENGNVQPLKEQEYNGTVKAVSLNDKYAAVAFEGKVQLHTIEDSIISVSWEHKTLLLPVRENVGLITSHALTPEFLIYATDAGFICYFILDDWQLLTDFQHEVGIQWLFPDPLGTQLAFMDASGNGYIYSPVKKTKVEIPNVSSMHGILWDIALSSRTIFVAFNKENVFTYAFHKNAIIGPRVILAGSSKLQFNHNPLLLYNGELTCQAESTHLDSIILKSHPFLEVQKVNSASKVELSHMFTQSLMLLRFADTWPICEKLQLQSNWNHFAQAAIYHGELDIASQVYRRMGDAAMVLALQDAKGIEEKNLQAGHLAALLSDFDLAQTLYLSSSDPLAALMLRCDLQHWENAIQLAKHLAPQQIPFISKEYASQLEFTGDYVNAIKYYEEGMKEEKHEDHINACNAGLARSSLHVGNVRHGVDLALTHPSQSVQRDCAAILKDMKQFFDAGLLYEMSQNFDKAASMYIRCKNWAKVGDILRQITSPKILLQYAKAKESDCSYNEAAEAYEKAKDHDNHIRMLLEHLGQPEAAMRVAQQNHSLTGAKMVARFLLKLGDYSTAIHFLAMSHCGEEAFQLAQKHGQMETYAEIIGPNATTDELQSIALHFEEENKHHLAGKFFLRSGQYAKALKHFLSYHTGEDHSSLDLAIETISLAKDEVLKSQLIDYLMGETDGIPKDAHYLFRLYMALDQHEEAARTAIIITREEQAQGNYRSAHDMLFNMYQTLGAKHAPAEMAANLLLLHSYVLVKVHIKIGNHLKGAHLLMRVAKNISKFPMHVVPILTSTVIECHRASLHMSAFSYASMLMRPEYRNKIDAKYSKRIEAVVRRPNSYELEENNSPCPFCNHSVPNNELLCPACKNNIPYCIASGQHMVRDNWSVCPHCNFPACYSEFTSLLETESTCPMCSQALIPEDIHLIADPTAYLQAIGTHD